VIVRLKHGTRMRPRREVRRDERSRHRRERMGSRRAAAWYEEVERSDCMASQRPTGEIAPLMRLPHLSRFLPIALRPRLRIVVVTMLVGWCLSAEVLMGQSTLRCAPNRRVRAVSFTGSPHFDAITLAAAIVTQDPSFFARVLKVGSLACADTLEIQRDALRIAVLHRQAGWFQAAVSARLDSARNGLRINFNVTPGPVAIVDTVRLRGLPDTTGGAPAFDAPLRALQGKRFDRVRVDSAIDVTLSRVRDAGYARAARPANTIAIDSATARVTLDLAFAPGRVITISALLMNVQHRDSLNPRVDSADVLRLIRLRAGQRFSASAILNAQRDLYRTDAFRLVLIDTQSVIGAGADSLLELKVGVAEAQVRDARVGLGWATQDCIRVQGRITDRGFLGVGRRVELSARASKIGVGAPTDFAPSLCSGALRTDPFSEKLNYYVGSTVSNTRLFGYPLSPRLTIYSERRGEPFAYLRETTIGSLVEVGGSLGRRTSYASGFQYENGRTQTDPAVSCTRFGQCRPEDYVLSFFGRGVGILSTTVSHDRSNDAVNPTRGARLRSELRAGQTFSEIVSSLRFYRATGEGSTYFRLLGGTIATRLQIARAFAPGAELVDGSPLIPQQERLFAGGQNSVRGFQQNLLGPVVYVVSDVQETVARTGVPIVEVRPGAGYDRVVPRGGTALMVANFEWRRAVPWVVQALQLATFVDVGNVWEGGSEPFRWNNLRATPGLGLRLTTPVGPFRVDVGYSPYPPRAGRALYFTSKDADGNNGTIQCASPGNTVSISAVDPGSIFDCPSSYRPPTSRGVLSRLAFHFGLGQAF